MTPTEADVLLADRLLERRSRTGSVLSDEQAAEVERLLSPDRILANQPDVGSSQVTASKSVIISASNSSVTRKQSAEVMVTVRTESSGAVRSSVERSVNHVVTEEAGFKVPQPPRRTSSKDDFGLEAEPREVTAETREVSTVAEANSLGSTVLGESITSWFDSTGTYLFKLVYYDVMINP